MASTNITPREVATAITMLLEENDKLRRQLEAVGCGVKLNAKKLTRFEVREIRQLWSTSGLTQRAIAEMYDVNPATVSRIVRRQYHAKVAA